MNPTIAVALSGGIDSLTAAYLLKTQGYPLIGIHFTTGFEEDPSISNRVARISDQLDIPITLVNHASEFAETVVNYFTEAYKSGLTPNPCMICNQRIKFGSIFKIAKTMGASLLATGHYARTVTDGKGNMHLLKGIDPEKDQSYFLSLLSRKQLESARFPLGGMTKKHVRELAREKGLSPATHSESQDICFIGHKTYGEFLAAQPGFNARPGVIEDVNGRVLGQHEGLHLFTIGQRRGINCPAAEPYYVARLDVAENKLVVGHKSDLLSPECGVSSINWIQDPPFSPISVFTRVRYRHQAARSTLFPIDGAKAIVRFESPQEAITPGQGAVFYQGEEVLGAGWIDP